MWSFTTSGFPHKILPQGSDDFGISAWLRIFITAGLNWEVATRLFTKGALKVICRPLLHAGDVMVVKSPAIIAAVGTKDMVSIGSRRVVVPW